MILKNNSGLIQIPLVIITACLFTLSLLSIPTYFFNQSNSNNSSVLGKTYTVNIGYTDATGVGRSTSTATPTRKPTSTPISRCIPPKSYGCNSSVRCCAGSCLYGKCIIPTATPTRKPTSTPISRCIPLRLFGCTKNRSCCSGVCVNYQCITPKSVGTTNPVNIGRT